MMCFKTIVLLSAIACLISAEKRSLKERIFNCKLIPLKKHHSIFDSVIPSIEHSLPVDSTVPIDYTVPTGVPTLGIEPVPTLLPDVPQQEVQYPPQQEVQYPLQPEAQYPAPQQEGQHPITPQQEVLNPPQQEVLNPPQHEVLNPPQQEVENQPQPEVQNPPQQQILYPPQHEGQRPSQHYIAQNPPSNKGLYPPQHNGQYYPLQNEGLYYAPSNYQGFTNVPYNYPVYGQNVLRSVKSFDGQMYITHQQPYRINMHIPQPIPIPYYNNPLAYGLYAAPQYNYVPQPPKTPKALVKST